MEVQPAYISKNTDQESFVGVDEIGRIEIVEVVIVIFVFVFTTHRHNAANSSSL